MNGIKKIARPINKAKNEFVKWLKCNNATDIDVYEGEGGNWDYYRSVDAFIDGNYIMAAFEMWGGKSTIDYKDNSNKYYKMTIDEFMELINKI